MNKVIFFIATVIGVGLSNYVHAQDTVRNKPGSEYLLTIVKDADKTSVKNQDRSGTCWSFSTLSFIESEVLRLKNKKVDLSPMWIVRHTYEEKAEQYVRMHGHVNFDAGGAFHDVTNMIKKYGIVPRSEYQGLNYGEEKHKHGELNELLKAMVGSVTKNKNKKLSTAWFKSIQAVLDVYFGEKPETFKVDGKSFTPKSYQKELGIVPSDYVELTSYTHQPFYSKFVLEVPDNWSWDLVYNVKLDEMMSVLDNALDNGYTIAWGADISEDGFSFRNGLAIVPEQDVSEMSKQEKKDVLFNRIIPEKKITQEMRQKAYDNYETTDDHGMHITGYAKDKNGTKYYIVKNSWGTEYNKCDGYFYASEAFVKYKTMDIMVHKDAVPKSIAKKLNF